MYIVRLFVCPTNPASLVARLGSWAPPPLRRIVGYGFMAYGYAKFVKHPENFAVILHALNGRAPRLMAWTRIAIELLGGLAIFVGVFVPLVTISMIVVLLDATFTVHQPSGFTSIKLMTSAGPQFGLPEYESGRLFSPVLLSSYSAAPDHLPSTACSQGVKHTCRRLPWASHRAADDDRSSGL